MAKARSPARLHGLLIIDKPAGMTSHDVVARVRRITGERKVGHAGTLDPMATGVLPVAIGDATRVIEYLAGASKRYRADVTFGVATDSLDADGLVTSVTDAPTFESAELQAALDTFRGSFEQIPPMHAAIKVDGVRLYELARQGIEIERAGRPVTVHDISLVDWQAPTAIIDVHSSKGFYVRSLARDLGERLGTVAHLSNLVRFATGPFSLAEAWTLTELDQLDRDDIAEQWRSIALHPDALLGELPAIVLSGDARTRWHHGLGITLDGVTNERVSVYADNGDWIGVGHGEADRGQWLPDKVISGGPAGQLRTNSEE